MDNLALYIVLYIFLVLLIIGLISFATIFLMQKVILNKQYKLMKRFNYFNDNPIASNLKPISFLVEKNSELEPLYNYFSEINETYKSQMEKIKLQLFELTKYNKNFHLKSSLKYIKQISDNLDILKKEEESFKILNIDTYSYTNNTSDISIKLSDIMNELNSFMRDNNIKKEFLQANDSLKNVISQIELKTKEINDNLMSINIIKAHQSFVGAIVAIQELFQLVSDYYQIYRYQLLIKNLTNNLKRIINENRDDIISKSIKLEIKELLETSNTKINVSNKALWSKDLDTVKNILSEYILNINKCITDIRTESKFKKLLDKTFSDFKILIKEFSTKYNSSDLFKTYKRIGNDFSDVEKISDLLIKCTDAINDIFVETEKFKKTLSEKSKTTKETIETINKIYKKIKYFFDINKELNDLLTSQVELYFSTVQRIDKNILSLNFLLYTMEQNNIINNEIKHDIKTYLLALRKYQNTITNSKNIEQSLINEVAIIENSIDDMSDQISDFLILKTIANRLLMYCNKDIPSEPVVINKSISMIKEGKYKEAISELIDVANKIKREKRKGVKDAI